MMAYLEWAGLVSCVNGASADDDIRDCRRDCHVVAAWLGSRSLLCPAAESRNQVHDRSRNHDCGLFPGRRGGMGDAGIFSLDLPGDCRGLYIARPGGSGGDRRAAPARSRRPRVAGVVCDSCSVLDSFGALPIQIPKQFPPEFACTYWLRKDLLPVRIQALHHNLPVDNLVPYHFTEFILRDVDFRTPREIGCGDSPAIAPGQEITGTPRSCRSSVPTT